ncbi:MAG: iron-containing redox enzyme family protein [Methylococcales bacterium]
MKSQNSIVIYEADQTMIAPTRNLQPATPKGVLSDRELFYQLLDPERFVDQVPRARDRIRSELSQCSAVQLEPSGLFEEPLCLDRKATPAEPIAKNLDFADGRTLILQFAPAALLGQCWLQRYCQARNCHTDLAAALFRVYQASLNPNGHGSAVKAYEILLAQAGIDLPPIDSHAFCEHDQLSDIALRHALLRLCLARCAPDFPGELIGFTVADVFGLSGIFDENLIGQFKALGVADDYQASRMRARPGAIAALQDAVGAFLRDHSDHEHGKERMEAGFRLYAGTDRLFWSSVLKNLQTKQSPADRVLAVFRKKARVGQGFHKTTLAGGVSLDDWFANGIKDGPAFLDVLTDSAWFDISNPEESPFFTRITAPDGLMSGVFTPNELSTIRDWLEARRIAGREIAVSKVTGQISRPEPARQPLLSRAMTPVAVSRPGIREMFYRLVNVEQFPEILSAARDHVGKCLRFTKVALLLSPNPELKCFHFSHAAFQSRIDSIYRRQVDAYSPLRGKPRLDRETWVRVIKQFAPTVLVDGCWLQNIKDPGMANCPIANSLWKIYAEEIGNGESRSNHPVIYRQLLESLDIDLPAIDNARFANHRDFIAGAFDIPVYLLAISQFPRSFLAELIGVNLAIELSGLGGTYLKLAESLDYWRIASKIVRIHQSADNMASGHSAIATMVVSRYLDHILSLNGERAMQDHWQRIWLGFVSIRIVPLRFIGILVWRYLARFAIRREEKI